jgi:hypothetical protein
LRVVIEQFHEYTLPLVITAVRISDSNLLIIAKPNITMPLNLLTSSMSNVSETFWSGQTLFETRDIGDHDWYLINVDRAFFYRVNYEERDWMRLTRAVSENRDEFSDSTISQLIDDSLSLARDSLLSYRIAFDLLEAMANETSLAVWSAVARNILELNNRLHDLDIHQDFTVRRRRRRNCCKLISFQSILIA